MTQRTDALAVGGATTENFAYDTLNRLLARSGAGPGIPTAGAPETVSYDVRGNISTKSGVGTYGYGVGAGPQAKKYGVRHEWHLLKA